MKKYLASFIPFVFCSLLSLAYMLKTPNPAYPPQSETNLHGLALVWFFIGIVISCVFVSMFFLGDAYDWLVRKLRK